MNNNVIRLKIKQRLNKLSSNDFDNIQDWQMIEAFNKGMPDWCRRNLHGTNAKGEGDEQSTSRIDDLQVLLTPVPISPLVNRQIFYEGPKPKDYLRFKRIDIKATKDCCTKPKPMDVYLAEEANINLLLKDVNKRPNYEWGETFATFLGNNLRIYTNNEFEIVDPVLIYYRQPRRIQVAGIRDPYTGIIPVVDVESEFNDDLIELLIDEAVTILAWDIESINQANRNAQNVEKNN